MAETGEYGYQHQCVTPSMFTAGLNGVTGTLQNSDIMQTLGDIKASVPLAEAQVQLALAGQAASITSQITSGSLATLESLGLTRAAISSQTQALSEQISNVGNQADRNLFAISQTIVNDGEKTRALINSNAMADLQRQLTVSESRAMEDRLFARNRETEINISNVNTATAQQMQAQSQAQAQSQLLVQLNALVHNLSGDIQAVRQTQSNVNFGTQLGTNQNATAANNRVS